MGSFQFPLKQHVGHSMMNNSLILMIVNIEFVGLINYRQTFLKMFQTVNSRKTMAEGAHQS